MALCLLAPLLMAPIWPRRPAAAGGGDCSEVASDAFATDPMTTRWDNSTYNADPDCEFKWYETGEYLRFEVVGQCPNNRNRMAFMDTSLGDPDQWACATYVGRTSPGPFDPGISLRAASSTAGSNIYQIVWVLGQTTVKIQAANFGPDISDPDSVPPHLTASETLTDGDVLCAQVTGTGDSTVFYVWTNPTGATPDDWGTADDCLNDLGTDGCEAAHATGTPGYVAGDTTDTGNYAGVRQRLPTESTGWTMDFDDFSAGECAP